MILVDERRENNKAKEREREYKIGSMWKYHSLCSDILQKN